MRIAEFIVPESAMCAFAVELDNYGLDDNRIVGATDDHEIIVEISYEKEQAEAVDELEESLVEFIEGLEDEEEE